MIEIYSPQENLIHTIKLISKKVQKILSGSEIFFIMSIKNSVTKHDEENIQPWISR